MKKFIPIILSVVILAGCSGNSGGGDISDTVISEASETTTVTETETETEKASETAAAAAAEDSETASETASVMATIITEEEPPTNSGSGVNADGTLNGKFTKKIEQLMEPHMKMAMGSVFPTLWDFDEDGVPEIILIFHSGSQGSMPCKVYSAEALEEIGEFTGFCRDGFTRFVNRSEVDTVIYNYYEHSNWQRVETVDFVKIEYGKLFRENKIIRSWQTGDNMVNAAMVVTADNSDKTSYENRWYLGCNYGNVCTSYGNFDIEVKDRAKAVVESYNNYIKMKAYDYPNYFSFAGIQNEGVFFHEDGKGYFMDESGEKIPLSNEIPYEWIYRLWDDIIVCQPLGNSQPCDVYIMADGRPVLDEKISGHGMMMNYSKLYNGSFELTESAHDNLSFSGKINGAHTFKEYQFYRDESGFHEYGSIVVPLEEFNKVYGEKALQSVKEFAEKEWEIYEVLYRGDCCFILNCYEQVYADNDKTNPADGTYYIRSITLKPMTDGSLTEVYRSDGVYKTALIPEIAVYPEKYYTEGEEWDKCIVNWW